MLVGTMRLEIHLPAADSLKAKRSVVNHVKERVRHRFNAAIEREERLAVLDVAIDIS